MPAGGERLPNSDAVDHAKLASLSDFFSNASNVTSVLEHSLHPRPVLFVLIYISNVISFARSPPSDCSHFRGSPSILILLPCDMSAAGTA